VKSIANSNKKRIKHANTGKDQKTYSCKSLIYKEKNIYLTRVSLYDIFYMFFEQQVPCARTEKNIKHPDRKNLE
tara:strand:- start:1694 stop:1915 length:222 start_codon:yes stop_codon:yes gene_type:complete